MYFNLLTGGFGNACKVLTTKGQCLLSSVSLEETLVSLDKNNNTDYTRVWGISNTDGADLEKVSTFSRITLENGVSIDVFGDIACYISKQDNSFLWVKGAEPIDKGDILLDNNKKNIKVESVEKIDNMKEKIEFIFLHINKFEKSPLFYPPVLFINNILFGTTQLGDLLLLKDQLKKDSEIYKWMHTPIV